jgi:transglutaminase-like putative cysteine protease
VAPAPAPAVAERVVLAQRIRYEYSAPITALRQQLIVVPRAHHGAQHRRSWHLVVDGAPATWTARLNPFGNLALRIDVPVVERSVEFAVTAELERAGAAAPHRMRPDRRYLEPTTLTAPDAAIAALAPTADPAAICARVHAAFTYEWGITGVRTTAAEALAGGRGVCQDYAHVMLAACRSVGLAARYVSGHLLGEGASHAWVETLVPDPARANCWLVEAWDPTHDRRALDGYVTVAVGRDYRDVAPMSGTYEGIADNQLTVDKRVGPEALAA